MPSGDLESERQWIEAQLEHLGHLALEGENVGTVVGQGNLSGLLAQMASGAVAARRLYRSA